MPCFLHTADLQIGKPFNWATGRARTKLQDARERSVNRIGTVARKHEVDFVLIAGDLFDDNTVGDDIVSRTCERLSEIDVPVYVLPGNHDFAGSPSCVYRRDLFQERRPDNVNVILEKDPVFVGGGGLRGTSAAILPAPVKRKSERGDPTSHITPDFGPTEAVRIGLAHGGVEDFGAGAAASRIQPDRAKQANLDYLALGDWHGTKEVGPSAWYSGTPEPDSFMQNDPGNALVVEIDEQGTAPAVEQVDTAEFTWLRKEERLEGSEDLEALKRWFEGLSDPLSVLVRLDLSGSLGLETMSDLGALKERLENLVLDVRHRGEVRPKASEEEINSIGSGGYVTDTVEELRALSETGGEESETAQRALQLLYQFHRD
jgi:DNA repair exonuclease SbcCD nuclease subunit